MKQFQTESKSRSDAAPSKGAEQQCAQEILNVIPAMMRTIRGEVRRKYRNEFTIPQLQSLALVTYKPDASVSDVAEHLGLTLPSASKIVDALVLRGLLTREASPDDRRRMKLRMTETGRTEFEAATRFAKAELARTLSILSESDLKTITRAMQLLHPAFIKSRE
jgi:DNA-binding MarR family transcriptional regulator